MPRRLPTDTVGLVLLTATPVAAPAAEAFKVTASKSYRLVVENVYQFDVSDYLPPAEVHVVKTPAEATYDNPEAALVANISAMVAADYDWFLKTFTPEARASQERWNAEHGKDAAFWQQAWKQYYPGRKIILDEKFKTGSVTMITYWVVPAKGGKSRQPRVLMQTKDGKWLATELPPDDPMITTPWPWPAGQTEHRETRIIRR